MITTAFLVNTMLGIAFLFAASIALYIVFKIGMSILRKAKDSGVTLTDGLQSNEVSILKKLLKEELEEKANLEALGNIKRVIEKATQVKS